MGSGIIAAMAYDLLSEYDELRDAGLAAWNRAPHAGLAQTPAYGRQLALTCGAQIQATGALAALAARLSNLDGDSVHDVVRRLHMTFLVLTPHVGPTQRLQNLRRAS